MQQVRAAAPATHFVCNIQSSPVPVPLRKQLQKAPRSAPNWRKSLLCSGSPERASHKWCICWEQARLPHAQIYSFEVTDTHVKRGGEFTALPYCWVAGGINALATLLSSCPLTCELQLDCNALYGSGCRSQSWCAQWGGGKTLKIH